MAMAGLLSKRSAADGLRPTAWRIERQDTSAAFGSRVVPSLRSPTRRRRSHRAAAGHGNGVLQVHQDVVHLSNPGRFRQVGQGIASQNVRYLLVDEPIEKTTLAPRGTDAHLRIVDTIHDIDGTDGGLHDLSHRDLLRRTSEPVASSTTGHRSHQTGPTKISSQLLQIAPGDLLPSGHGPEAHRLILTVASHVQHHS
jgi:hypothetical protein